MYIHILPEDQIFRNFVDSLIIEDRLPESGRRQLDKKALLMKETFYETFYGFLIDNSPKTIEELAKQKYRRVLGYNPGGPIKLYKSQDENTHGNIFFNI